MKPNMPDTALNTPPSSSKPFLGAPAGVWLGALALPLIFTLINFSWYPRAMPGWVHSGYLQNDQHLYTAYARAVFERGNGIFYANPYDADPHAPRIFTNLGYLLLGWLRHFTGMGWVSLWELLRLAGGTAMGVLLWNLIRRFTRSAGEALFLWGLALSAGGVAWLAALPGALRGEDWLSAVIRVEDSAGYGWWLLNIFRQGLYPLETLYHALLYGVLLAFLARRAGLTLALLALLWWTHPITGLLGATAVCGASLVEIGVAKGQRTKDKGQDIFNLSVLLGGGAISAVFAAYNNVYIASFPSGRSFIAQTTAFQDRLTPLQIALAFGPLLLVPLAALARRPGRRFLFCEAPGRFILVFAATVFIWTHNDWFLGRMIQPIHFARGHAMLALVLLLAAAVRNAECGSLKNAECGGASVREGSSWWVSKSGLAVLGVLLVLFAADNLFFVGRLAVKPPYPGLLTLRQTAAELLDHLNEITPPSTIVTLDSRNRMGTLIPSQTPHRVVIGDMALTPFYNDKLGLLMGFLNSGDPAIIQRYQVRYLIADREQIQAGALAQAGQKLKPVWNNADYTLFESGQ